MDVIVVVVIVVVVVLLVEYVVVEVKVVVVVVVKVVVVVVAMLVVAVVVVQSNHTFTQSHKKYPQSVLYDIRLAKLCLSVISKYCRSITTYEDVVVG